MNSTRPWPSFAPSGAAGRRRAMPASTGPSPGAARSVISPSAAPARRTAMPTLPVVPQPASADNHSTRPLTILSDGSIVGTHSRTSEEAAGRYAKLLVGLFTRAVAGDAKTMIWGFTKLLEAYPEEIVRK